jgi:hypothetical protein
MIAIAWEFLTSKVGRYIIIVGSACAAIVAVLVKVFGAGKAAERQKQQAEAIDVIKQHHDVEQDVARRTPGDVDRELRKWAKD